MVQSIFLYVKKKKKGHIVYECVYVYVMLIKFFILQYTKNNLKKKLQILIKIKFMANNVFFVIICYYFIYGIEFCKIHI